MSVKSVNFLLLHAAATVIMYPFLRAKTLMQSQSGTQYSLVATCIKFVAFCTETCKSRGCWRCFIGAKTSAIEVLKDTIDRDGFMGLYKGLFSEVCGADLLFTSVT